jgi:hypothetical protein
MKENKRKKSGTSPPKKIFKKKTICMRLAATWLQFACDWPPVACKAASFLKALCKKNYLN